MVSRQSCTQLETLILIQMPVITRSSAALQPSTKRAVADDLLEWQGESQHEASVNEVLRQRKKSRTESFEDKPRINLEKGKCQSAVDEAV
jgi:hypothetical protein